ncbi:hypothetical protein [Enterobacter sp. UPMP2052]
MKKENFITMMFALIIFNCLPANASCQIQLSSSQVVLTPVTRGQLMQLRGNTTTSSELRLEDPFEIEMHIACDEVTPLALEYMSQAYDSDSYRFGINGRATLTMHDVTIDGKPVKIYDSDKTASAINFRPGRKLTFWRNSTQISGVSLNGGITLNTWITSSSTRLNDVQSLDMHGILITR